MIAARPVAMGIAPTASSKGTTAATTARNARRRMTSPSPNEMDMILPKSSSTISFTSRFVVRLPTMAMV